MMRHLSLGQQKVLLVLALFLFGILYLKFDYARLPPQGEILQETVVEVMGEVRKPGVYIFTPPPTLKEAIERAGGLKEPASFDEDIFSELIKTGTLLNIQKDTQREIKVKIGTMEAHKLLVFSIPLDLNQVSVEDLCLIPGIGESLAYEITAYRARRRGFRSIEELKNVKGIGDQKFRSLAPFFK